MEYSYSTLSPKPNSWYQWESWRSKYPEHRMVLLRRTNKLIPTGRPNRIHYRIRCTCKKFKPDAWFSPGNAKLQRIYMIEHISKIQDQGILGG